jgi:hypothetical protein
MRLMCTVCVGCLLFSAAVSASEGPPEGESPRARARAEAQYHRLGKTMYREGPSFDEAKYNRYVSRIFFGSLLLAGGVASTVFSVAFALNAAFAGWGDTCESDDCDSAYEKEEREYRTKSWVSLAFGVAGIAIGIPLVITGAKGRNRQLFLRDRKDEILKRHRQSPSLSTNLLIGYGAGGLVVSVSF